MNKVQEYACRRSSEYELNPMLLRGFSDRYLDKFAEYINDAMQSLNDIAVEGFSYEGYKICNTQETLSWLKGRDYDIAANTIYLVKYIFKFRGVEIPWFRYYPYLDDNNILWMGGSSNACIVPLSDKVISPSAVTNTFFIRVFKYKVKVARKQARVKMDGKMIMSHVLKAKIYMSTSVAVCKIPVTMHYMLAKWGLEKTIKMITGSSVQAIELDKYVPEEGMVVYSSAGIRPRCDYVPLPYTPSNVGIVVRKEDNGNDMTGAITNLFSILDAFPSLTTEDIYDINIWKSTLGRIILPNYRAASVLTLIDTHLYTLDTYVEASSVKLIQEEFGDTLGMDFSEDGFYKLLVAISRNYIKWTMAARSIAATTQDKRLNLLYFLAYEMIKGINTCCFRISQENPERLSVQSIIKVFNGCMSPRGVFAIKRQNACVTNISVTTDHPFHTEAAKNWALQLNLGASGNGASSKATPVTMLHPSQAWTGSAHAVNKSTPGVKIVNPWAPVDLKVQRIVPSRKMVESTKILDEILKISNNAAASHVVPEEFNRYGVADDDQ